MLKYLWFNWVRPGERDRQILEALAECPCSVPQLEEKLGYWLHYPVLWSMEEKGLITGYSDDLIMPERGGRKRRFYAYKLPE